MENFWSLDPILWIVLGVISLAAILTGVGLIAKAFSFQSGIAASLVICVVSSLLLTAAGVLLPLLILAGQTYEQHTLFVDILMIGITGLVLIAVASFMVDHLTERPSCLMISAGACFAIAVFPLTYQLFRGSLNDHFRIEITQSELDLPRSLEEFSDRYSGDGKADPAIQPAIINEADPNGISGDDEESERYGGDNSESSTRPPTTVEPDWLYENT